MDTAQAILKPGDVIGKYRVVRCLGIGGMGEVHLVIHQQLNIYRALKLLRTDQISANSVFAERFMREARIASRIQHQNIISVIDVENDAASGFFYIVMEYVNGNSLFDVLRDGTLSEDQAIHIISEVAKGLAAASEVGLVHRDIKPSNIMISQEGEVKLADLGIAKASDDDVSATLTMENSVVGTPAYSAPEQCSDAHDVDVRADIYSLGATLYEMVTGLPPFDGANAFDTIAHVLNDEPIKPRRLNPKISEELENLILKMMAKDRTQRPQNIAELLMLLKPFQAAKADIPPELKKLIHERVEREVQARTSTVITAYKKKQTGERLIILSAVIVLLIAVCIFFFYRNSRSQREIRHWKNLAEQHRNEKEELSAQIFSLKNQLDRQKRSSQNYSARMEQTVRTLTEEINRLKNTPSGSYVPPRKSEPVVEKPKAPQSSARGAKRTPPPPIPPPTVRGPAEPGPAGTHPAGNRTATVDPPIGGMQQNQNFMEKQRTASRKCSQARMRIMRNPADRKDIEAALKRLDAKTVKRLLEKYDITFEDLSFESGNLASLFYRTGSPEQRQRVDMHRIIMGLVLLPVIQFHSNSSGWNTREIHEYLSFCIQNGYRVDRMKLMRVFFNDGLRTDKEKRNYLTLLEFLLIHPNSILFERNRGIIVDSRSFVESCIIRTVGFADFPAWLERLAGEGRLNLEGLNSENGSLLDRLFLKFHQLPSITPAHFQCLKKLEQSGAKYQILTPGDRDLILAIRNGDLGRAEQAIRNGADPRKAYPLGGNALFFAAASGVKYNPDIIRLLLKNNTPTDIFYSGRSPLTAAIEHEDKPLIDLLIQKGAKLNDTHVLEAACRKGNVAMAELLLRNGTAPGRGYYVVNKNGRQVKLYNPDFLFDAMESKSVRIAELLLEKGIYLKATRNGKTPLEIAESDPALKRVAKLIRKKLAEQPNR